MIRLSIPTAVSLFRLFCFAICFGLLITAIPIGARRMQGPPIPTDLPNLDELRGINPGTPKAPPPVPATKCRGRDEKCKQKVKRGISSNLTGDQDRTVDIAAGADHRFSFTGDGVACLNVDG